MSVWRVEIDLEGRDTYTVTLPKLRPDEDGADVCQRICKLSYPTFQESEKKYTVINSNKIIRMEIEEVDE